MINYNFLKTLNILYIESNESIRKNFLKMIDGLFNNVIWADNGRDGISKFIENKKNSFFIDIVISDIFMPDIDGIKVLEKIRNEDIEIPIVLVTNNLESNKLLQAIKYNVSDYLPKPVNKRSFIDSIQKVCSTKYYDIFKKDMEENLEELINAINDVALVTKTDIDGNITFVNKYFCDTFGYSKKEVIGQTHSLIILNNVITLQIKELWDTILQGKVWEGKVKNISKTKEIFFGYLTVIPIFNPFDNSIKEYMWIRFLSTEEEIEQSEFKKKVVQNIHSSRRINLEARAEIDRLFKKLERCKTIEFIKYSLLDEKKRTSKFINQIFFYKKEVETKEKTISELSTKANIKIKRVVETEHNVREKRDNAVNSLDKLVAELDLKNKDIKALNKELDKQIDLVGALKATITKKERTLGLI